MGLNNLDAYCIMDGDESDYTIVQSMTATSSSTGGADDYDKLFTQTSIDLSNKHLEKLPNLRQSYPKVEVINLSHNQFKFINNLSKFSACREAEVFPISFTSLLYMINVSFNALERFSSFLPLADALKRLDISHNALSNCDNLAALTQLVWLDAAYNHIQVLPLLDRLAHLTYLNVSSNRLSVLPNLSKLPVLKILILNDNGISTLDDLHRTMPQYLQDLDIGANVITDLREAQHLSCLKNIRSLVFAGNPCVRLEGRTFCYRPYLYCCCLEQLQIVDGKELSETEIIKGEELHTHAKIRRMETHAQLCAYLEKECPEDCHHTFSPDDNRLMKILKKRREHASRLKDDMTSEESTVTAISPYREWLSKSVSSIPSRLEYNSYTTQQKENCVPLVDLNNLSSLSARISTPPTSANSNASSSTVTLSAPSVSSSTPVRSRIQRRLQSKPVQVRKISFTTNNTPKKSNTVDHSNWSEILITEKILRESDYISSAKHQKSLMRNIVKAPPNWPKAFGVSKSVTQNPRYRFSSTENSIEISFVSARKVRNYSEKEKKAALLIQSWWRGMKIRRLYRVPFLQKRIQRFETLLREKSNMILKLKNQLANLEYNIETIVAVNEEQAMKIAKMEQCLAKISETCNERQKQFMNKLLPVPDELQYIRKSDTEVLLQWQNHQRPQKPTRYLITVNGNPCGTVRGLHKKVLVTDLDPTKESVIRMQCVFNEFSGDISECLVIPSHKQETSCINEGESAMVCEKERESKRRDIGVHAAVKDKGFPCLLKKCYHYNHTLNISRMSLMTDDLDVKYGVMNQNDSESADKKKRKKSKGRALEIDFPLHSSGLMQWSKKNIGILSYESSICYGANNHQLVPAYPTDTAAVGNDCSDVINQLLPTIRDAVQEFLYDVGSRACEIEEIDEPFHLSNSDTALSPAVSSLSNVNNSNQLLTLMKGALNSTSDASTAKPLSSITNDFTKYWDELLFQQNGDIFYDQNTELVDQRMFLQDARFHLERRFIEQRLKDVEKRYEERLSNASLMLKKAYKEILDLRLGKAKALANKRMGQAELALKHANAIHSRIADETVKSDIKQMIRQWEQILRDYKAWHANLDRIVDGQKAQVDSNYRFDELALLSPPDNIPCAPQLPPNALKYFQQLEFECSSSDPSSELLRVIGPPIGFEKEAVTGGRFGAIGQPAPPPQRKIFTEAQINKLVEKTLKHFQDTYGNSSNLSAEEIRNILNDLERRPLVFASDATLSSVLSHVIKRVMEVSGTSDGKNSSQPGTPCWTSLSSESSAPFITLSYHSYFEVIYSMWGDTLSNITFSSIADIRVLALDVSSSSYMHVVDTVRRSVDLENQDCKICLQSLAHGDKLIQCP
ncbi:unnamed protein product, partial [Brugia timori]|uniref:Bm10231 n=1 Tax=Brugia timori TaxID=42155 RepID=A0A0R3QKQ0_9BILA